jgi:hypothetical protein
MPAPTPGRGAAHFDGVGDPTFRLEPRETYTIVKTPGLGTDRCTRLA